MVAGTPFAAWLSPQRRPVIRSSVANRPMRRCGIHRHVSVQVAPAAGEADITSPYVRTPARMPGRLARNPACHRCARNWPHNPGTARRKPGIPGHGFARPAAWCAPSHGISRRKPSCRESGPARRARRPPLGSACTGRRRMRPLSMATRVPASGQPAQACGVTRRNPRTPAGSARSTLPDAVSGLAWYPRQAPA